MHGGVQMSLLVRPEPFSTEFNRLFNSLWDQPTVSQRWVPEMDLVETDDHYLLKADLPGMKQEDVAIEFNDGADDLRRAEGRVRAQGEGLLPTRALVRQVQPRADAARRHQSRPDRRRLPRRRPRGDDPEARGAQAAPDRGCVARQWQWEARDDRGKLSHRVVA